MLTIIENILDDEQVRSFRHKLETAEWTDGATSAGTRSIKVKQNFQLGRQDALAVELGNIILRKLGNDPLFVSASLAEKIWPPIFNLYQDGGHYGTHSDAALMRLPEANMTIRSDLSATLFLSEPDEYDGGELVIEEHYGAQPVKLAAGDMILYPSSSLHAASGFVQSPGCKARWRMPRRGKCCSIWTSRSSRSHRTGRMMIPISTG